MAQKSSSLLMMMKDEKKYQDVVDILDGYEQHLMEEIFYTKASVVNKRDDVDHQSEEPLRIISGQSSTAHQTRAHFH